MVEPLCVQVAEGIPPATPTFPADQSIARDESIIPDQF